MFRARQELHLFLKKLFLLTVFLIIFLSLCRMEDFFFMRRWESYRAVDPSSLSIRALTSVLACRGIHSRGVFEREDLLELVRSSGPLSNVEVGEAIRAQVNPMSADPKEKAKPEDMNSEVEAFEFSSPEEFDDLTEKNAWVVEVRQDDTPTISAKAWYRLGRFLKTFNIRMGHLHCHLHPEICHPKEIFHSGLLLISPKDRSHLNDSVNYSWFPNIVTMPRILNWLEASLAKRVLPLDENMKSLEELETYSITSGDFIVALHYERLTDVPLLFSALSIRFDGLVRFWRLSATKARSLIGNENENSTEGTFFFVNGNLHYEYGQRPEWSEATTFGAIEFFLKTNYPDTNDVLKSLSLFVCMLASLSIVVNCSDSFNKTFVYCVRSFLIYVYFFIFYLPVAYILSMRNMRHVRLVLLSFYQSVTLSKFGGILRRDYLAGRYSFSRIIFCFIIFVSISIFIIKKRRSVKEDKKKEEEIPEKPKRSNSKALSRSILKQECCICQEYCRLGEILQTLSCGHAFHQRCIQRWRLKEDSCPNCHFPIDDS